MLLDYMLLLVVSTVDMLIRLILNKIKVVSCRYNYNFVVLDSTTTVSC